MNIDQLFSQPFQQQHSQTNGEVKTWNLKRIDRFPFTDFIVNGDCFFHKVWRLIDESKDYFWMTTYAINSSSAADTTLLKLIEAARRGVHVVLFVDNVQFWAKPELIKQFENSGGRFLLLNPQFTLASWKGYCNKDVWRRHHEKLIVSDSWGLIGSANIEGSYAGIRYGSCQYQDLNYVTQHIALEDYRQHFVETADLYGYSLHTRFHNEQLAERLNRLHPNSTFYPPSQYRLLHNDPLTNRREIEDSVVDMVRAAKQEVKIVQPYYYPMVRFDKPMVEAARRGVAGDILTSGQRDQPVLRLIFNYTLFQRLILNEVRVFETKERLLHSKVYMTDGRYFNLGSMNNDRWSWKINNEVNLAVDDPRGAHWIDLYFQRMKANSRPVTLNYILSSGRAASISFWQNFLYLSEILMSKRGRPEEAYVPNDTMEVPDLPEPISNK